ncbi:MAG: TMEM43 family protein [Candidatus Dojkabacteria bacterium]|nr:TMEM43 family protein [Candidatus Dojkabacteria bacterium]
MQLWGCKILSEIVSFIGAMIVVFAFGGASVYWMFNNELSIDLSEVAKKATNISPSNPNLNSYLNNNLISIKGKIETKQLIGDDLYLKPGRYLAIYRKVEMYSWVTYIPSWRRWRAFSTYDTRLSWEEELDDYTKRRTNNPPKLFESTKVFVSEANIGQFKFDPKNATLPEFTQLKLSPKILNLDKKAILMNENYIFIRNSPGGTPENPENGDIRISYYVLYPDLEGNLFGKLDGKFIGPYLINENNKIYRVFNSDQDPIKTLHDEYINKIWPTRISTFFITLLFTYLTIESFFKIKDIINKKPKNNIFNNIYEKFKIIIKKIVLNSLSSLLITIALILLVTGNYVNNPATLIFIYLVMTIFAIITNAIIRNIIIKPPSNYYPWTNNYQHIANNPVQL